MSSLVPGDPGSVSALAGELGRHAETVRERREMLARVEARLEGWGGLAAEGFRSAFRTQTRAFDDCAEALHACGRALQEYAVDLAGARARASQAQEYCDRHGLRLHPDGTVTLPWGSYSVEQASTWQERLPEGRRLAGAALAEADDAARRLARAVEPGVHMLTVAGHAALAAVTVAATSAHPPGRG